MNICRLTRTDMDKAIQVLRQWLQLFSLRATTPGAPPLSNACVYWLNEVSIHTTTKAPRLINSGAPAYSLGIICTYICVCERRKRVYFISIQYLPKEYRKFNNQREILKKRKNNELRYSITTWPSLFILLR